MSNKKSKTTKSPKKTKKEELKSAPPLPADDKDSVGILLSREEMTTLIGLMNIVAQTFETLAMQAINSGDDSSYSVFSARQKLCKIYYNKLINNLAIGEPDSREYH